MLVLALTCCLNLDVIDMTLNVICSCSLVSTCKQCFSWKQSSSVGLSTAVGVQIKI